MATTSETDIQHISLSIQEKLDLINEVAATPNAPSAKTAEELGFSVSILNMII
jgi:hypothetical protein